jgi:uncharacterized membrane-anchored protein YhcB (DUF1043 family)
MEIIKVAILLGSVIGLILGLAVVAIIQRVTRDKREEKD